MSFYDETLKARHEEIWTMNTAKPGYGSSSTEEDYDEEEEEIGGETAAALRRRGGEVRHQ